MISKYIKLIESTNDLSVGTIAVIIGKFTTNGLLIKTIKPPIITTYAILGLTCRLLDSFETDILKQTSIKDTNDT